MIQFLGRRLATGLLSLLLLSVIVFFAGSILPGNIGRHILGPEADAQSVAVLNAQLGADQPVVVRYWDWLTGAIQGDLGTSLSLQEPVAQVLAEALVPSLKLTALIVILLVPIGLGGGILAAVTRGRWIDRTVTVGSAVGTTIPEFVSGLVLILLFGIWLNWFPVTATAPAGAGFAEQIYYLLLPASCLVFLLTGYVIRVTRAGVSAALASDYTRTAVLKGLPRRTVWLQHVLRTGLMPSIAVIATQTGILFGGLVVIEVLFSYQGIGQLLFTAANQKDMPVLQGGVIVVGLVFFVVTWIGDLLYVTLDPRLRPHRTG